MFDGNISRVGYILSLGPQPCLGGTGEMRSPRCAPQTCVDLDEPELLTLHARLWSIRRSTQNQGLPQGFTNLGKPKAQYSFGTNETHM